MNLLDPAASTDTALVDELCALVNDVYAVAEEGMWRDDATRTSAEELAGMIAAGEILVASTADRRIVGSVRLHDVAADTSEFGILVAARDQRGLGIGRALVDEVERRSRQRGLGAVQLELLVPRDWSHPTKEFLTSWYGRRGYRTRAHDHDRRGIPAPRPAPGDTVRPADPSEGAAMTARPGATSRSGNSWVEATERVALAQQLRKCDGGRHAAAVDADERRRARPGLKTASAVATVRAATS